MTDLSPKAAASVDALRLATLELAEDVFEDKSAAAQWFEMPNHALGGDRPCDHCQNEERAQHVRRILRMIESGGPV